MPKEEDFLTDKSKHYMEKIDSIHADFENALKHYPEAYAETKVGKNNAAQTVIEDKISSYMTKLNTIFLQVSADIKKTNKSMHDDVNRIKNSKDEYKGFLEESNELQDKNYAGSTLIHDYTIRYRYEIARIIYLLGGIGIMAYIIKQQMK
jgi:hypothetical protein|tara:strand:+ start:552 stop:1001 length:450 start_codon:yes stop_codon:yes gene_type:complete